MSPPVKKSPTKAKPPAKSVVTAIKTPVKSGRYDGRSRSEYLTEGMEQALRFFEKHGGKRPYSTLSETELRQHIDALDQDAMLQVTMADFWLNLSKEEARARRATEPPKNPFRSQNRSLVATKGEIEKWELKWRDATVAREYRKSGSAKVRARADDVLRNMAWVVDGDNRVLGLLCEIPVNAVNQSFLHPQRLRVEWMSVERALRKRWLIHDEQVFWLDRFVSGIRAIEAEVTKRFLEDVVSDEISSPAEPKRK